MLGRPSEGRGFGTFPFGSLLFPEEVSERVPAISFTRSLLLPAVQQAQKSSPELF